MNYLGFSTKRFAKKNTSWISILYTDWFYAFGRLSKKGQNLFSILVSSLQLTELNTFIIVLSKKGQNLFGILVSSLQLTELNTFIIVFY